MNNHTNNRKSFICGNRKIRYLRFYQAIMPLN